MDGNLIHHQYMYACLNHGQGQSTKFQIQIDMPVKRWATCSFLYINLQMDGLLLSNPCKKQGDACIQCGMYGPIRVQSPLHRTCNPPDEFASERGHQIAHLPLVSKWLLQYCTTSLCVWQQNSRHRSECTLDSKHQVLKVNSQVSLFLFRLKVFLSKSFGIQFKSALNHKNFEMRALNIVNTIQEAWALHWPQEAIYLPWNSWNSAQAS